MEFTEETQGYLVTHGGRAVARVLTADDAGESLPREAWLIHFCAGRFTAAELTLVLDGLDKLADR